MKWTAVIFTLLFATFAFSMNEPPPSDSLIRLKKSNDSKNDFERQLDQLYKSISPKSSQSQLSWKERQRNMKKFQKIFIPDFIRTDINQFEARYLFLDGKANDVNGNPVNSFEELLKSTEYAKKYLVNLDRKLFQQGILPSYTTGEDKHFDAWFDNIESKVDSIIDADILILKNDLKMQFEAWRKTQKLTKDGKLSAEALLKLKKEKFVTEKSYLITDITWEKDAADNVEVRAKRLESKVVLGVDETGKPNHFERKDPQSEHVLHYNEKITNFSKIELTVNALVNRDDVAGQLDLISAVNDVVLDMNNPTVKEVMMEADKLVRRKLIEISNNEKPGFSGGSAIKRNKNGEVESIIPKEVIEEYKRVSESENQKLMEIVRENADKVVKNGSETGEKKEDLEKMWRLVEYEQMRTYVSVVNTVNKVQSFKGIREIEKAGDTEMNDYFNNMHINLSNWRVKISASAISGNIFTWASRESARKFGREAETLSSPLGAFFIGKSIIDCIDYNVKTCLATIGSRVGFDVVTRSTGVSGVKSFSKASKFGKFATVVGKAGGSLGAVSDAELGIWSMTKNVERFHRPTNKYDRDDAIANIFVDNLYLAMTEAVTALPVSMPVAPPEIINVELAMDVGSRFVTPVFPVSNNVRGIKSEVSLLPLEENDAFYNALWSSVSIDTETIIMDIAKKEKAYNLTEELNSQFLQKNNETFRGIVFPSRTIHYDGGCCLYKQYCEHKLDNGCAMWGGKELQVQCGCDYGKPCSVEWGICSDRRVIMGTISYNNYECRCSGNRTDFGELHKNSVVDFRMEEYVYLERTVPKDLMKAEFMCKPGSQNYEGMSVSQLNSTFTYLCENAIGLLQPRQNKNEGQPMLFKLEDGDDTVYHNGGYETPNVFLMGEEGRKRFFGGKGKNEFVFDEKCSKPLSGQLYGYQADDAITISENCGKGQAIFVDFKKGNLSSSGGTLSFYFQRIKEFHGRRGEVENVVVDCSTRKVVTQGGSPNHFDVVIIPSDPSCLYNLTVVGAPYTNISIKASKGDIIIPIGNNWTGLNMEMEVQPRKDLRINPIFLQTSSSQVTDLKFQKENNTLRLDIHTVNNSAVIKAKMMLEQDELPLYFTESPKGSPNSFLFLANAGNGSAEFYHSLSSVNAGVNRTRRGCKQAKNIFQVIGENWRVTGGDKADMFRLRTNQVEMLDGGDGEDTLRIARNVEMEKLIVDLGSSKFKSLENIYGAPGLPIVVKTACDTLLVIGEGGSAVQPDIVNVSEDPCEKRNLKVVALGNTRVIMNGGRAESNNENDLVQLFAKGNERRELYFELESAEVHANLHVTVELTHKNWTTGIVTRDTQKETITVQLQSLWETAKNRNQLVFQLKEDTNGKGKYLRYPFIKITVENSSEVHGVLLFDRITAVPNVMYNIDEFYANSTVAIARGFSNIENLFRASTTNKYWRAAGGELNDQFILTTTQNDGGGYTIDGGVLGENSLLIDKGDNETTTTRTFVVNLVTKQIGYTSTPEEKQGSIDNIHHVFGRAGAPDVIHPNCNTKMVNGRGGLGAGVNNDAILISPLTCDFNLVTTVESFTSIKNKARKGQYTYFVKDLTTSSLEFLSTQNNKHYIELAFHPWEVITSVAFNKTTETMAWKLGKGPQERVQVFPMWRPAQSEDFSNPIFEYHPSGKSVSADIRVTRDGVTVATYMVTGSKHPDVIQGIPVNVNIFLVNITSKEPYYRPTGAIQGCVNNSICSTNRFWIYSLEQSLKLLDGGVCFLEGECTNYLKFLDTFPQKRVYVDMDINHGSVRTETGKDMISLLKNINQLHGAQNMTAYVTCDTKHVSGVDQVVVRDGGACRLDLVVGLHKSTTVTFEARKGLTNTIVPKTATEADVNSIIYYRLLSPMSFDPKGDYASIIKHKHIYYLPFKMDTLKEIKFSLEHDQLSYTLDGFEYFNHIMISGGGYFQQFYTEPSFMTADGYTLQIGQSGSIMAVLSNGSSTEISLGSVPELQKKANSLGITIMIYTINAFYYIGHSFESTERDRNALQNIASATSHLAGGGNTNTIYEILHLDRDVWIHTGFSENTFGSWLAAGNGTKQTIDLTDVVIPIRMKSGTKYLPVISADGDNLVIWMKDHDKGYPGKIIIVNGVHPWVAKRMQVLLSNSMMDITDLKEQRQKRSLEQEIVINSRWVLRPSLVIIPAVTNVYSLSRDELEDNQLFQLEQSSNAKASTFKVVRNGANLIFTNIITVNQTTGTTIKINDFYASRPQQGAISGVIVQLTGLCLMLNNTQIYNITEKTGKMELARVTDWSASLQEIEEALLWDMPDIPRRFRIDDSQPGWMTISLIAGNAILILIFTAVGVVLWRRGILGELMDRTREYINSRRIFVGEEYGRL